MTAYPHYVASLAEWVDTQHGLKRSPKARWVLVVWGPFCSWPAPTRDNVSSDSIRLANQASALLGLPCNARRDGRVIHIDVVLTEDDLRWVRERVYEQEIRRR